MVEIKEKTFQTLDFSFHLKEDVLIGVTESSVYFTQYNQEGGVDFKNFKSNTTMGARIGFEFFKNMNIILDIKDVYYDTDYDGKIEKMRAINTEFLISF